MNDPKSRPRIYECDIVQVHSGDDLIAMVDLGHDGLYKKTRMRLRGVDTPDAYKAGRDTKAGSVRDQVRKMVTGRSCQATLHAEGKGGWVVTLHFHEDGEWLDLNAMLIDMGYVFANQTRD